MYDTPTEKQIEAAATVWQFEQDDCPFPSYAEIADKLKIGRSTAQNRVERCIDFGLLERDGDGKRLRTTPVYDRHRRRAMNMATNPVVTEIIDEQPELVEGWTDSEKDQLYSYRGMGGALTRDGVVAKAGEITENRELKSMCEMLLVNGGTRDRLAQTLRELHAEVQPPRRRRTKKKTKSTRRPVRK